MTAAEDVRREYVQRHRAGEHSWQSGPLIKTFDKPDHIILVCGCGELQRRSIPNRIEPPLDPRLVHEAMSAMWAEPFHYSDGHVTAVIRDDAAERFIAEYNRLAGSVDE